MSGNRRVARTDRRPGEELSHIYLRGRIHRCAILGQDDIETGADSVSQLLHVKRLPGYASHHDAL
ncbi:hypothetical protein NUKP2_13570 [Klebsiella quasipneumoniae]|nr:hypothetical protein NUKP2_13570 [Klebsiella quasipneumoniae]